MGKDVSQGRRDFLKTAGWGSAALAFSGLVNWQCQSAKRQPNILFLFSDDQRFDTIAALDNPRIQTPNLDQLVKKGVAFTRAFIMGGTKRSRVYAQQGHGPDRKNSISHL